MTGLRVLHVIGGGDSGGAMTHLLPLVSALGRMGCDVRLLCLGEGRLAEEASRRGSSVAVLSMGHAWDASVIGPLSRVVTGGPADFEALQMGRTEGFVTIRRNRALRWTRAVRAFPLGCGTHPRDEGQPACASRDEWAAAQILSLHHSPFRSATRLRFSRSGPFLSYDRSGYAAARRQGRLRVRCTSKVADRTGLSGRAPDHDPLGNRVTGRRRRFANGLRHARTAAPIRAWSPGWARSPGWCPSKT